jgi:N-acyl-phosphatidylethanolamine-hydrolysing phospholipase D
MIRSLAPKASSSLVWCRPTGQPRIQRILLTSKRQYISLRDLVFGERDPKDVDVRLGTPAQPIAKKVDGRYVSPWSSETEKKAFDVFKYLLTAQQMKLRFKKRKVEDTAHLVTSMRVDRAKCRSTQTPHFTWIGHATCYYQTDGVFFITDPLWSERASPSQMFGPKRFVDPPIEIEDLKIDVVLLSHTHYDHLDADSAKRIGNKALW